MKKLFVLALAAVLCLGLNAQIFSKGDKVGQIGIGIGSYIGGSGYKTTIPPISGSFEYGIVDGLLDGKASIGVGGYLAYTANKWETSFLGNSYGFKNNYFILGARGAFHYQFIEKLDTYAGLMLGYNVVSGKYFGDDLGYTVNNAAASAFGYSAFIGARYYFTEQFAAFAEVGYGIAALELGIAMKF